MRKQARRTKARKVESRLSCRTVNLRNPPFSHPKNRSTVQGSAPPPASSPAEAAPTPAGGERNTSAETSRPAPDGHKPGNNPLPTRPKTPVPGPPPPPLGPAPIDDVDGPPRAGKNPQPGPLPPDPPPRLIDVHRHRAPKGLHQLLIDRLGLLRQPFIGLAQARGRHLQTPGHPEQLRHLPRDAQPMLQVRRQRPRPRPEADPRRPRRRRHLPGMARPHPLPASTTVATLRPKPRDDRPDLRAGETPGAPPPSNAAGPTSRPAGRPGPEGAPG